MKLEAIYVDPIFNSLIKNYQFFLVSVNMMIQPRFQGEFIETYEGKKVYLELSIDYEKGDALSYNTRETIELFNKEIQLRENQKGRLQCNIEPLYTLQGRQIAIIAWDIIQSCKYNKHINKKEIIKFLKHIRNGASHNNVFNITPKIKKPITWRKKTITNSLHNQSTVFPTFITTADLIILLSDISEIIKKQNKSH